jgi:simple sugar transport system ATP-binding protein
MLGMDENISYSYLKSKLDDISNRYQLPLDLDAPITTLSAGEKQRVEIVRILLQDPQLLIMDEPTSVLTPQEVTNLFKTLKALIEEGRTILYITHKLEEVINLCECKYLHMVSDEDLINEKNTKELYSKLNDGE